MASAFILYFKSDNSARCTEKHVFEMLGDTKVSPAKPVCIQSNSPKEPSGQSKQKTKQERHIIKKNSAYASNVLSNVVIYNLLPSSFLYSIYDKLCSILHKS